MPSRALFSYRRRSDAYSSLGLEGRTKIGSFAGLGGVPVLVSPGPDGRVWGVLAGRVFLSSDIGSEVDDRESDETDRSER